MNYYQYNLIKVAFWTLLFVFIGYVMGPVAGMLSALIFLAIQNTYFRYDDEKSEPRGIGCMKCFASLPVIKEKTKSKKYPDLRDLYMEAIDGIKGPEIWKDGFRFGAKEVVELLATKIEKNQIQIIERELKLS